MIRNALAIAWKELQVLAKDRGQLIVLFLMPLIFSWLFGSLGGESTKMHVYLVNLDGGQYGGQVVKWLHDVDVLDIEELETVKEADAKVADGEAVAAIVIPADFSQDIDAFNPLDDPARVQVIVDPAQQQWGSLVAGGVNELMTWVVLQGEISYGIRTIMNDSGAFDDIDDQTRKALELQSLGAIMTQLQKATTDPLITVKSEDLEGVETQLPDSMYGYSTTRYTVMFAFFIVSTIAATVLAEKEEGTFRRLLAAPIHRASIILGKMLAYTLVVGLQVLVMFGIGSALFHMPLGDSPLGLVLLTLALALAATSLGMLVAALAHTRSQADNAGVVLGLVLALVGGVMTGLPDKGSPLYWPAQLTPHAHAIKAYLKLMVGANAVDILPQMGLLVGVGALFFIIAMRRLRFE
jgi:ABC-2 type transport system permease protein